MPTSKKRGRPATGNAKSKAQRQREYLDRRAAKVVDTEAVVDALMAGMVVGVFGTTENIVTKITVEFPAGKEHIRDAMTEIAHSRNLDLFTYLCRDFADSLDRQMKAGLIPMQVIDVAEILELSD